MEYEFVHDARLGISLPVLHREWDEYTDDERAEILDRWEHIRGTIPDRIKELERVIMAKQERLNAEDNFIESCRLNSEITDLASCINELHIWFRLNQNAAYKAVHL